jgi:hypothetical protein
MNRPVLDCHNGTYTSCWWYLRPHHTPSTAIDSKSNDTIDCHTHSYSTFSMVVQMQGTPLFTIMFPSKLAITVRCRNSLPLGSIENNRCVLISVNFIWWSASLTCTKLLFLYGENFDVFRGLQWTFPTLSLHKIR